MDSLPLYTLWFFQLMQHFNVEHEDTLEPVLNTVMTPDRPVNFKFTLRPSTRPLTATKLKSDTMLNVLAGWIHLNALEINFGCGPNAKWCGHYFQKRLARWKTVYNYVFTNHIKWCTYLLWLWSIKQKGFVVFIRNKVRCMHNSVCLSSLFCRWCSIVYQILKRNRMYMHGVGIVWVWSS